MLLFLIPCLLLAPKISFELEIQDPIADPSAEVTSGEPQDPAAEIAAALSQAVDLPTPAARRKAAQELAKRGDVSLDQWLDAAAAFGEFEAHDSGQFSEVIPLMVEGKSEPTSINYWVPSSYRADTPTSVLLALHGAGGVGVHEIQTWQAIASDLGMLLLAPTEAGANMGYGFTNREQESVLQALRWFRRKFNVDENQIHLTGVSRGGHLCWELALRHPGIWASVSPRIGGPSLSIVGGRNTIRLAANLAHIPLRLLQGLQDDPKMIINQRLLFERLKSADAVDAKFVEFSNMGHNYDLSAVPWTDFFGNATREPNHTAITLRSARPGEGEMYWLRIEKLGTKVKEEFQPRVNPNEWNRWNHEEKARFIQIEADERTAEIAAHADEPGKLTLKSKGVKKIILRLTAKLLNSKGRIEILYKGKTSKKRPKASSKVFLLHFVENFDREFLPLYEIKLNG